MKGCKVNMQELVDFPYRLSQEVKDNLVVSMLFITLTTTLGIRADTDLTVGMSKEKLIDECRRR